MYTTNELHRRIASLESQNDHLISEITYVDQLLRSVGFEHGLASIKGVIESVATKETEV